MKKVFVDTNILVDLLADRQPFSKFAIELFELSENGKVRLFTSSHSIATTYYILKKYITENKLRETILDLLELVSVIAVDLPILKKGLLSTHKDFEDAIQIFAAGTIADMDFIVTRNIKDYKNVGIAVLPPDEILNHL
jgi:predicted nucleic acid-binding protein